MRAGDACACALALTLRLLFSSTRSALKLPAGTDTESHPMTRPSLYQLEKNGSSIGVTSDFHVVPGCNAPNA